MSSTKFNPNSDFASKIMFQKYSHTKPNGQIENWNDIAWRTVKNVMSVVNIPKEIKNKIYLAILNKKFLPGGRYLYATGRIFHNVQNCLCLNAEDSREGWADLMRKSSMALMTGSGIGICFDNVRCEGSPIAKTGGVASGPISLMQIINESARHIIQGGSRRSAVLSSLNWQHNDIIKFIHSKDWSEEVRKMKEKDYNFPAALDMTNISVNLDDAFFSAFNNKNNPKHSLAHSVYMEVCTQMFKKSEPGFAVNIGDKSAYKLRNACSEYCSDTDSDVCNLGSINLARVSSLEEMEELVELGTIFLLAGSIYTDVPYEEVIAAKNKNRNIGLGLMGIHEFLLKNNLKYEPNHVLWTYLEKYMLSTVYAEKWAKSFNVNVPKFTRAIAPTGTISIVAETTSGIEPIFCTCYKRRYLKGTTWHFDYVLDPTAKKLIDQGVNPNLIEDAYSIDFEKRIAFQAWIQQSVDMAISSTCNLPAWGTEANNSQNIIEKANILMKYLPKLRGVTCYADGSRGGQPLTPVTYSTYLRNTESQLVQGVDICDITKGGSCG